MEYESQDDYGKYKKIDCIYKDRHIGVFEIPLNTHIEEHYNTIIKFNGSEFGYLIADYLEFGYMRFFGEDCYYIIGYDLLKRCEYELQS
jgi:hypothetical protein